MPGAFSVGRLLIKISIRFLQVQDYSDVLVLVVPVSASCVFQKIFPFSSHSVFSKRVTLFCFLIQFKCSGFYIPSLSDIL